MNNSLTNNHNCMLKEMQPYLRGILFEFLSELRPLTTFLEKTTTSGHICFAVEVDGREFKGYGLTKIGAKQNAAIDALRHTFNIVCTNTGTLFSYSFFTVY